MYLENKFLQFLIRYRVTIIILTFVALMFIGFWTALVLGIFSVHYGFSEKLEDILISIFFAVPLFLLVFYIVTGVLKYKINQKSIDIGKDESEDLQIYDTGLALGSKKIRLFMACFGSFVGSGLIIILISIPFGFFYYVPDVLSVYFFIGWIIWFPLAWKFFNKKLK